MLIKTKSFTLSTYSKGDPDSKKLALVLPGKLDSKDYSHMRSHVDFLAKLGYFALSFDPPGTWESPGDISLYTTSNYLKAVDELIKYFGDKPIFLIGHSRGASVAIIIGSRNTNVTAYTAIMPSFSEKGFDKTRNEKWKQQGYKISMRDLPPGGGEEIKEFNLPYKFFEDQISFEWSEEFAACKKPKLIIVGNKDTLVSPTQVRQVFEALSQPKELYELNSDHDYRLDNNLIEEVNKAVGGFLQKFHQLP